MRIADEAEPRIGRKVAWGASLRRRRARLHLLSVPVMTRLRMNERQVLDTLVDAGVARSRSEALAWCVRLVGEHQGDWIEQLRDALVARREASAPTARTGSDLMPRRSPRNSLAAPRTSRDARSARNARSGSRRPALLSRLIIRLLMIVE